MHVCVKLECNYCMPLLTGRREISTGMHTGIGQNVCCTVGDVASFPGPACSSLAVRNSLRGPGLVHHVMSATVVFLRYQITMFAVLPMYMYNGVSS